MDLISLTYNKRADSRHTLTVSIDIQDDQTGEVRSYDLTEHDYMLLMSGAVVKSERFGQSR